MNVKEVTCGGFTCTATDLTLNTGGARGEGSGSLISCTAFCRAVDSSVEALGFTPPLRRRGTFAISDAMGSTITTHNCRTSSQFQQTAGGGGLVRELCVPDMPLSMPVDR